MKMNEYIKTKQGQIAQYQNKAKQYRNRGASLTFLGVVLVAIGVFAGFMLMEALEFGTGVEILTYLLIIGAMFVACGIVWQQRRHAYKSAELLKQFIDKLDARIKFIEDFETMKAQILTVETNFLAIITAAESDNMHDVVAYVRDWQTDNQARNAQLLTDFGKVAQALPGKATFDKASGKLSDVIGGIEERAYERKHGGENE